jgi:hypothetical protein
MGSVRPGVTVDLSGVDKGLPCGTRRMDCAWTPGVEGVYVPGVHSNCWHNELSSLKMRTMGEVPAQVDLEPGASVELVWKQLRNKVRWCYNLDRWSVLRTAESYHGRLRRRYLRAVEDLKDGLRPGDAELKPFLKAEKIWAATKLIKPRMIFPRSPRYNLLVASYLKPFEHWLWGRLSLAWLGLGKSGTRLVMKGLNPRQRAHVLLKKFRSFEDCVCFEVDGSAFEAHVGKPALLREHAVYKAAYPGASLLDRLLRKQLVLKGRTTHGIAFRRDGGRASGDFNTGMGNSLIMLACTVGPLLDLGVKFDLAVDGDNAIIFLERAESSLVVEKLGDLVKASSGQEFVLERPVDVFENIRFGQSQPVLCNDGAYIMLRDYREVISKALSTHRYGRCSVGFRRYCRGVAECELSMFRGMPIVQSWCLNILRNTPKGHGREGKFVDFYVQGLHHVDSSSALPISEETRRSFATAFGVSPCEQKLIERLFSSFPPSDAREVEVPNGRWQVSSPGIADYWAEGTVLRRY